MPELQNWPVSPHTEGYNGREEAGHRGCLEVLGAGMKGQSRRHSFIEAWVNIAIGFGINYFANLLIFPLFGFHISLIANLWMGVIYTGISLVRSYFIRRYFNTLMVKMHLREGE
jgi:hypothetical protein